MMEVKKLLNKYAEKKYSQFGEDGILNEIFNRIDDSKLDKWCVEFGAKDGVFDSNTYNLIKNHNYSAVLIEGSFKYFKKLEKKFTSKKIIKINKFVSFDGINSLDNILNDTIIPKNFDFLSIDVDGCDYYIFENLNLFTPKILAIEFNHLIPNEVDFVQKKDFNVKQGSSAKSIINLAKNKNYHLVANTMTNLFFVHENYKNDVEKEDIFLETLRDDSNIKNLIFTTYDGTLFTTKPVDISWHKMQIESDKFQILPKFLRKFPGDYNIFHRIFFYIFREIKFPGRFIKKILKKKLFND